MRFNKFFFSVFCFVFLIVAGLFVQREYFSQNYSMQVYLDKNADPTNTINQSQVGDIKKITKIGDDSYEIIVKSPYGRQFFLDRLSKNVKIFRIHLDKAK